MAEETERDAAVLIAVDTGEDDCELSVEELKRLAETAGIETVATVIQKADKINVATYIGEGKAREIRDFCEANGANLVIADDELKGSQVRELEELTGVRVIDRTTLILDIFAQRARSVEGKLQVELAQYAYRLPRLTGYGNALSRLGGGIGTRGPGETKLETDRRHIKRKMAHIREQLDEVAKRREQTRKNRKKNNVPTVALVGYTNAGKSSLMNVLCEQADVYVQDQLFATLDPTTRRIRSDDGLEVVLTDTVGFIRKLPTDLINAFSSTLEESLSADLLLHVIDASDPEAESQTVTVNKILYDLGATGKPVFYVYNKTDLLPPGTVMLGGRDRFFVSTYTLDGIENLREAIFKQVVSLKKYTLLIPYTDGKTVNLIHQNCTILSEEHTENGTKLEVMLSDEDFGRYGRYAIDK